MRVLIVERRSADTRIHSNGLAAEGIATHGARSGADAVDGSLNGHCDLVLLDLVLAGLSGLEALEQLHHEPPELPVIVVPARDSAGSNVVDLCIRRLRRKLGPTSPIETLRHARYRLATD